MCLRDSKSDSGVDRPGGHTGEIQLERSANLVELCPLRIGYVGCIPSNGAEEHFVCSVIGRLNTAPAIRVIRKNKIVKLHPLPPADQLPTRAQAASPANKRARLQSNSAAECKITGRGAHCPFRRILREVVLRVGNARYARYPVRGN